MSMLVALMLAAPPPALPPRAAPPRSADAVLAAQRRLVTAATAECRDGETLDDEILVCARRDSRRARLPYPARRDRSDPRLPGEQRDIDLTQTAGSCGVVGRAGGCTGGLDVFAIARFLGRLAISVVDPELVADPPPPIPPMPDR